MDNGQELQPQQRPPLEMRLSDSVRQQLREQGLSSSELSFYNDREANDINGLIDKRAEAEKNARNVHTLEEAESLVGIENARDILVKFMSEDPQNRKEVAAAFGRVRQIESRVDYMVDALRKVTKVFEQGARTQDEAAIQNLGNQLVSHYLQQNGIDLSGMDEKEERKYVNAARGAIINELMGPTGVLPKIAQVLQKIRDLSREDLLLEAGMPVLSQKIKEIKEQIKEIESQTVLGFQFISRAEKDTNGKRVVDLHNFIFDQYTVHRPDWYNDQNAQHMENAIMEAAKFAGGHFLPNIIDPITHEVRKGGKYAMYTEHEDGSIEVHLENVNEYIIYRIAMHMNFQDPDDPIEILGLRLFETSFRSVTLYEFLVHDAEKYAQKRTPEGVRTNPLYQDFLMYWALQASSSGHVYNTGIQARAVSNKEDAWKEFYDKMCRSDKLTAANRFPRELRKLSREDIKEQIALTGRLEYGKWKDFDGHLGQAISEYATLDHYIFDLSHGGWDITQHLDTIDAEEKFLDENAQRLNWLDTEIGRLTGYGQNPKPTALTRYVDKSGKPITLGQFLKERERLNDILAGIQNGELEFDDKTKQWVKRKKPLQTQNYFFKTLSGGETTRAGREAAIINFLTDLTNKYMALELSRDSLDPNVKEVMARMQAAGVSFMQILRGKDLPPEITQKDRNTIVRNIIIRGGLKEDGKEKLTESKLEELANGDFGVFVQTLFTLDGNSYQKKDLNYFASYGGVAKEPLKGVVTDAIKSSLSRKYNRATTADVEQYEALLKDKKKKGETDKTKWSASEQALVERVTNGLTESEIEYVYEAGKEIAEWTMRAAQNDTGVSGNRFAVRIAHPGQYYLNNMTNLSVGDKETIDLIRNTQDMLIGVPVSVQVTDKKTNASWREMMWLGEFMERGMYRHRQTRTIPQFGEHSLSVFFTRRVEAALKTYAAQRDPKNDVYNLGQYMVGYVLGEAEYSKGLEQYTSNRNVLNDLLFASKYPLPYKRLIHEWVNEGLGGKKKEVTIKTMKTEEYLLGHNVFLMEDVVMANPDIKKRVDDGDWGRGQVLETMLELALVGMTLKRKAYFYMPTRTEKQREMKEAYEAGVEGVISSFGIQEVFNLMEKAYIGRFGAQRQQRRTKDGKIVIENVWEEGHRFTEEMGRAVFQLVSGVSIDDIRWKEAWQGVSSASVGTFFSFISVLLAELGKAFQGNLK